TREPEGAPTRSPPVARLMKSDSNSTRVINIESKLSQNVSGHAPIVEGERCFADDLIGLVSLPRDEDGVARLGVIQRDPDRFRAIALPQEGDGGFPDPALDRVENRFGIFAARIVGSEDDAIGFSRR